MNQSACVLRDGQLAAWAEEERFTREKHAFCQEKEEFRKWEMLSSYKSGVFPLSAIFMCLKRAGLTLGEIDYIAVGHSPTEKVAAAYRGEEMNAHNAHILGDADARIIISPNRMSEFLRHEARVKEGVHNLLEYDINKLEWVHHHSCHAISSIIPSEFKDCNYMTCDGDGGEDSGVFGFFDGKEMHKTGIYNPIGTIGGWYTAATEFLGFTPHSAEGKTMGLASYGKVNKKLFPEKFLKLSNGIIQPESNWYSDIFKTYDRREHEEIVNNPLGEEATSIAATLQNYLERMMIYNCRILHEKTNNRKFALAGGTFLNCSMNGRLLQQDFVDEIYVHPASHDGGTAYGAALMTHHKYTGEYPRNNFKTAYWGSEFTNREIEETLKEINVSYEYIEDPAVKIAELINNNFIIGLFQGKAEIGPRALCNRSILANPTHKENLDKVNSIKRREFWRPLAPVIAEEYYHDIVDAKQRSPFMLIAAPVKKEWKNKIPAVVHIDGSCRPQCVNENQNPLIHKALLAFREMSGTPVFLNTSFNLNDEPLVDSPQDAVRTFYRSDLDGLMLQNYFIAK